MQESKAIPGLRELWIRFLPVLAVVCWLAIAAAIEAATNNRVEWASLSFSIAIALSLLLAIVCGLLVRWASWQGKALFGLMVAVITIWLTFHSVTHTDARSTLVTICLAALQIISALFSFTVNANQRKRQQA